MTESTHDKAVLKYRIQLAEAELKDLGNLFMKIDRSNKYAYNLSQDQSFKVPAIGSYARQLGHNINMQIVSQRNEVSQRMELVRKRLLNDRERLKLIQ